MPTVFDQPADGDVATVTQLNQYASAVNALESGAAYWGGSSAGTTTAYTASLTPAASNTAGQVANLVINATNTGASTLAVNGQIALPIRKNGAALVAGDLQANAAYTFICDGTYWHVVGGGGSAGSTNASTAFSSGQVPLARGGTGADLSATGGSGQYVKQNSAGGVLTVGTIAAGDLPNHSAGLLTSGTVALARGGVGADLSATGGAGQVLKQTSAGGAITVAAIAAGDLPNHSTSLLTSGILPVARGGTGLGTLGTALQELRVNAGATALEFYTPTAGSWSGCVVSKTANQTITAATETDLTWDRNDLISNGAIHSTSTNNPRMIATIAGKWRLTVRLRFANGDNVVQSELRVKKNGTLVDTVHESGYSDTTAQTYYRPNTVYSRTFDMALNDYLTTALFKSANALTVIGSSTATDAQCVVQFEYLGA